MTITQVIQQKIAALTIREKVLLIFASAFLFLFGAYLLYLEPLYKEYVEYRRDIKSFTSQKSEAEVSVLKLKRILSADLDAEVKANIESQKQKIAQVDQQLEKLTVDFVPPQKMKVLLAEVLGQVSEVKLIQLESLKPLQIKPPGIDAQINLPLYQHGVKLTVSGGYFAIQNFLTKVETLTWKFHWNTFSYEVVTYPEATLALEITTVSANETFIAF